MASSEAFTEDRAREVLAAATGGPGGGAELLSLGENAVFALDGTVVRIGRDPRLLDRAEHELRVASWLEREGVPAVRAAEPSARLVDDHPVTFWQRLPPAARPATAADLAGLLRLVHALPEPPFALPARELMSGIERWLRLAGDAVPREDAAFLRARRDDIVAALPGLLPHLPPGPVHGDALPRNVHVTQRGPLLVDLETFSSDLREHDLVVMALSHDRYGLPAAEYATFCTTYGWDVRAWEGCAVLRGARETASCAWVAQHAPGNPAALAEFRRRVASLRDSDPTVRWHPF
ncbi:aminoglycoside phosphotransferase family protein [Streptomyces albus subsp. chlorinus]|uniref:aminoglycoside phosphotransferase family protein n=1 Tax=Streptomyces albus TaxID=1888 RepID=UPI0015703941|nr:aminoglycoside phosphotransferase family protein [Streptomyces albus]NSC24968.1 aminoglycoside phosphotransferase family protein [Streptomyces albus subsp. chlorinus]